MFIRKFNCYIGISLVMLLATSCFFFIPKTANNCCNFDPVQNKLVLTCGNDKLFFVKVFASSGQEGGAGSFYWENKFEPSVNETILPAIPDSIKQKKDIIIHIWNTNQVIWDYSIKVTQEDWMSGKLVFGRYSYR